MNVDTGQLYASMNEALDHGEKEEDLVEIKGAKEQVEKISRAIKAQRMALSIKSRNQK